MQNGIYEQVVSNEIRKEINKLNQDNVHSKVIDQAEAPYILSEYVQGVICNGLKQLNDKESLDKQVELANKIIRLVNESINDDNSDLIDGDGEQLLAVFDNEEQRRLTGMTAKDLPRPETSIAYSSLFTGAQREPQMGSELAKEISTADRIDMLVSFIKWSGLSLLIDELKKYTEKGGKLRVISTTYMGATDAKAIEELSKLSNTEVKMSFDSAHTRLHAKSYIFYRETGFSTAYVGSSNMSNVAMTSGREWNLKITKNELPEVFQKVEASFEGYWNSSEYETYDESQSEKLKEALKLSVKADEPGINYFFDVKPYPYQQAILDKLQAERVVRKNNRNLVVAATGCGKTIIAAFDYKRQCTNGNKPSLLFIAHRQEILLQSLECFREVLKDRDFGDLFVGNHRPEQSKHLFLSIDMFNSKKLWEVFSKDKYEFIVLDECHHAAARTYERLIEHFTPRILLGLTATPERNDGDDILRFFNDKISAEIRLPEAINRKLLSPFHYFGIADDTDLSGLRWSRGGYVSSELDNLYVYSVEIAKKRARLIIASLLKYTSDIDKLRCLAFCVSVEHAKFMSKMFNDAGIASVCLSGGANELERKQVKSGLTSGIIKIVCVVDIYNEGVDIKEINTVLFLRPTESLTIFLQQLGRGLRLCDGKDCLTVLDFVGQANKKYNFANKFSALIEETNKGIINEIRGGFVSLPKGCYIKLQKKAQDIILKNINAAIGNKNGILEKIKAYESDFGRPLSYAGFVRDCEITTRNIYSCKFTFTEAVAKAFGRNCFIKDEDAWKRLYRLTSIDSKDMICTLMNFLPNLNSTDYNTLTTDQKTHFKMLYASLFESAKPMLENSAILREINAYFKENPGLINEALELLKINYENIDFIDADSDLPFDNSLRVYCTYTRAQALAALDYWNTSSEGVTRVKEKKTTCLFITLNKSNSYYSPTTSYHDYSLSDSLFHWQSQNATAENTQVGQRYIHHQELGETILLFVREAKEDKYGSVPFTFLGQGFYVKHQGSKPMSIVWRMNNKIPAKYLPITDKLGIG